MSLFPSLARYELKHPSTKEPIGFTFLLTHPNFDDDAMRTQFEVIKGLKADAKGENFDLMLASRVKSLAGLVRGWENTNSEMTQVIQRLGFADDTYSPEKALKLLSMPTAGWIRAQLDDAVKDESGFFHQRLSELYEAIENRVWLDTPYSDGFTQRDMLLREKQQSGVEPKGLSARVDPPDCFRWIWMVFQVLSATRRYVDGQALPITHDEILAWSQLNDEKLSQGDLALLRTLDTRFVNTRNEFIKDVINSGKQSH